MGGAQKVGQTLAPGSEQRGQATAESLVDIGQLGREVAERTAADAVARALRLQEPIEKSAYLRDRIPAWILEARLERSLYELSDDLIEDLKQALGS